MIVEWNAHMFSSDTARYPFHPNAAYVPARERWLADPLATYLEHMKQYQIDRAVIVHPEPYGDDHSLVLDCLDRVPDIIKGTSLFYPRDPDAVKKMEDLVARQPRIVGTRFHAVTEKKTYLDSFDDDNVRAMWGRAGELGLIVELHIGPLYAQEVGRAIADNPETTVLIDHVAEPQTGTPEQYEDVLALAQYPNVYMKMSGLNHFTTEEEPFLDTKPLVQRVAAAWGPDRLVWSSGDPAKVHALLDNWSEADRAKVLGGTLARLAGF